MVYASIMSILYRKPLQDKKYTLYRINNNYYDSGVLLACKFCIHYFNGIMFCHDRYMAMYTAAS